MARGTAEMRALSYLILASLPLLFGMAVNATGSGSPTIPAQQNAAASGRPVVRAVPEAQPPPQAQAPQTEATLRDRLAEVERRNLILEARSQLEDKAYNQFSLIMAVLGGVITLLVLGFGFITHRNAVIVARQEIADLKDKVLVLHDEAAAATAEGRAAAEDAKLAANDARKHEQDLKLSSEKVLKDAVALAERVKLTAEGVRAELSASERETVSDAAKEVADKPEGKWSADEFRVKIVQAISEKDWEEVLRLSRGMEFLNKHDLESVAFALFRQAWALEQLGQVEGASAAYEDLHRRIGQNASPELVATAGLALVNRGALLGRLGRLAESIVLADQIIQRFGDAKEVSQQSVAAKAMFNKAWALEKSNEAEKAIAAYQELVDRFGGDDELESSAEVPMALVNMGAIIPRDQSDKAIKIYDGIIKRYTDRSELAFRHQVMMARINRVYRLIALEKNNESLLECNKLVDELKEIKEPEFEVYLCRTLVAKAVVMYQIDSNQEEDIYQDILAKFDLSPDEDIRKEVIKSLFNMACLRARLGKVKASIEFLERWKEKRGSFDCEAIAADKDFDGIRGKPTFRRYLRNQGCTTQRIENQ